MPNARTTPSTVAAHPGVHFAAVLTDEGAITAGDATYQPLAVAAAKLGDLCRETDMTPRVELAGVVVRVRRDPKVGTAVIVVDKGHPIGKSANRLGRRLLKSAALGRDLRPSPAKPEPASAP